MSESDDARLGAFRLLERAGRGGMGVVWRAEHVHQGVPAAVKFMTSARHREARYREQFQNEVHAMASLHHPGVAMVFDYGETDRALGGSIAGGSPYLVMEWAPGGTLSDIVPISTGWAGVRELVLEVLDALSHAHARGVIHRDLKPQNILLGGEGQTKLADFGLARRLEDRADVIGTSGTPHWMAPEQIRGELRDQGPWTDLYALGCVAFWLLAYRAPFRSGDVTDILRAHLLEPVPRLDSRVSIPDGVEGWLRRMLAKSPDERYRFAADAAHDLLDLPEEVPPTLDSGAFVDPYMADTLPDHEIETALVNTDTLRADQLDEASEGGDSPTTTRRTASRREVARTWARAEAPVWPMRLIGAGLGLWGLRTVPLVDRESERDRLWELLRQTHTEATTRVVILRGPAGTGKSRLAKWLAERAHEVGAAHTARATHGTIDGPSSGLAGLVRRHFVAHDLAEDEIVARIGREFTALGHVDRHLDARALTDLITHGSGATASQPQPGARQRWWAAWIRYLSALSADRPVILWFDDVQWGANSLGFVSRLLDEVESSSRVLVLLTLRDEELPERPVEAARIEALAARAETTMLPVERLDGEDQEVLVERLLRLEPSLARSVVRRTAGNPLFAVQLVEDWVQRGILEVGATGFELVERATANLPEDLRDVWSNRVRRFLSTGPDPDVSRAALEIAAVLGQEINIGVWRTVCRRASVDPPTELLGSLARAGLVRASPESFSFCHGMLKESLEATASEEGRAAKWHSACADFISETYGVGYENAERFAVHAVCANRPEEALEPILLAAESNARRGDYDRVSALFDWYGELLDQLGHGVTSERVRGVIQRARNAMFGHNLDQVDEELCRAESMVEQLDDEGLRAEVLFVRSRFHRHRGRSAEAIPLAEEALRVFRNRGDEDHVASALRALGEFYRRTGRLEESREAYVEAKRLFASSGDEFQVGWCDFGLAATFKQAGDYEPHETHVDAAITAFEKARSYMALGCAYNERGEVLRLQRRLREAQLAYEESLRYLPPDHADVGVAEFNLALTHIAREQWSRARHWLRRAMGTFMNHGRTGTLVYVELAMALCAAGRGDWAELDGLAASVLPKLAEARLSDSDIAVMLVQTGDLCHADGRLELARKFWNGGLDHWELLGQEDRAADVVERLSESEDDPD